MTYLARVRAALDDLESRALRRELRAAPPAHLLNFSSNDYLGMSRDPEVVATLRRATQLGSGGSRLLGGAHPEHAALEGELAAWLGRERALLFSSGYLAALGAIVTLAPLFAHVYSDEENHACIIDAVRASGRGRTVFPHGALPPPGERVPGALVVTESLFGMSGRQADVAALVARLGPDDALLVDEAHALGVLGPRGAGRCAGIGDPRTVVVGTLSKALGGAGGFVAGAAPVVDLLASRARTFVFDTAPPPALAAAVRTALGTVGGAEGDRRRARLAAHAARIRAALAALDLPAGGEGPIVPIAAGSVDAALALAARLEAGGIFAPAIRPPTVPPGTSRVRISVRADHSESEIGALIAAVERSLAPA